MTLEDAVFLTLFSESSKWWSLEELLKSVQRFDELPSVQAQQVLTTANFFVSKGVAENKVDGRIALFRYVVPKQRL